MIKFPTKLERMEEGMFVCGSIVFLPFEFFFVFDIAAFILLYLYMCY